ncbi:MAG: SH3 domain-containing protein [Chloroflexota bacterium]
MTNVGRDGARLRADPGTSARVVDIIREGAELILLGEDREVTGQTWRKVRDRDGREGWMSSEVLASPPAPTETPGPTATRIPTATPAPTATPELIQIVGTGRDGARLRAEPGVRGQVIEILRDGAVLVVIGSDREADGQTWRNVRDAEGREGWIAGGVLQEAPPTATPAPSEAAQPCRAGQVKGSATSGLYYTPEHPAYAQQRERVRCFDDEPLALAAGFRSAAPTPAPPPGGR